MSDLNGINKALAFLIKLEMHRELQENVDAIKHNIYQTVEARQKHMKKTHDKIKKKYKPLLEGLGEKV